MIKEIESIVERITRPGVLGAAGEAAENRLRRDIEGYFELLGSSIDKLDLPTRLEGKAANLAAAETEIAVDRVLRKLSPYLSAILSVNIMLGYKLADRQAVVLEAAQPFTVARGTIDRIGLSGIEASKYAASRAASLVTGINRVTRERMRDAVSTGITDQLGVDGLGRLIRRAVKDMSVKRAQMIASTEMNDAMSEASLKKMERLGIEYKRIVLSDDACPICEENSQVDPIPLDELYPSGDLRTPFHPNCRCAITGARAE